MDKATRILAIPLTSASYPESMDDLLDTISFHWRDSNVKTKYLLVARVTARRFIYYKIRSYIHFHTRTLQIVSTRAGSRAQQSLLLLHYVLHATCTPRLLSNMHKI